MLRCMSPVVAQAGHAAVVGRRLLSGVERTCRSSGPTSEFDPYSPTSLAPLSTRARSLMPSPSSTRANSASWLSAPRTARRFSAKEQVKKTTEPTNFCHDLVEVALRLVRPYLKQNDWRRTPSLLGKAASYAISDIRRTSEIGTTRTCRGGPTTSAVGGRTDMPFKRADFRV